MSSGEDPAEKHARSQRSAHRPLPPPPSARHQAKLAEIKQAELLAKKARKQEYAADAEDPAAAIERLKGEVAQMKAAQKSESTIVVALTTRSSKLSDRLTELRENIEARFADVNSKLDEHIEKLQRDRAETAPTGDAAFQGRGPAGDGAFGGGKVAKARRRKSTRRRRR